MACSGGPARRCRLSSWRSGSVSRQSPMGSTRDRRRGRSRRRQVGSCGHSGHSRFRRGLRTMKTRRTKKYDVSCVGRSARRRRRQGSFLNEQNAPSRQGTRQETSAVRDDPRGVFGTRGCSRRRRRRGHRPDVGGSRPHSVRKLAQTHPQRLRTPSWPCTRRVARRLGHASGRRSVQHQSLPR